MLGWRQPNVIWIDDLLEVRTDCTEVVLVTILDVRGSAPREVGAKMIVFRDASLGSIGGGTLEHECIRHAVGMLDGKHDIEQRRFALGPQLGQCCGGAVSVVFERVRSDNDDWTKTLSDLRRDPFVILTPLRGGAKTIFSASGQPVLSGDSYLDSTKHAARIAMQTGQARVVDDFFVEPINIRIPDVAIFGAGHVGSATVSILAMLDFRVRWIDSRPNIFPKAPRGVRVLETCNLGDAVLDMPPDSYYLVMTHDHQLDFEICDRILHRGDAAYFGLIGSNSKRRRFERRFRAMGVPKEAVDELVCPIGMQHAGNGKQPAEIAVSVAMQLLACRDAGTTASAVPMGKNVVSIR